MYFDRLPTLDTYHTRIMRDDGARLVRIRWYGDQDPTPQDVASGALVYVERKTHREKWSGEESSKVRGALLAATGRLVDLHAKQSPCPLQRAGSSTHSAHRRPTSPDLAA